jgi:hypothetical protein
VRRHTRPQSQKSAPADELLDAQLVQVALPAWALKVPVGHGVHVPLSAGARPGAQTHSAALLAPVTGPVVVPGGQAEQPLSPPP